MSKRVKGVTLTILTESPVPLSYDQGYGNYTPIKKEQYKNKIHAKTSISTITYDLRRILHNDYNWTLGSIILNKDSKGSVKNLYPSLESVESTSINGLENDIFGYFVPTKGKGSLTKVSPLRIIPFRSINSYDYSTQLITNRGFLESDLGRKYYDTTGNEIFRDEDFPTTQALAVEEVMGDYYVYTVTIELDRVGVIEVMDGKYLLPDERKYMPKELREKAVKDILDALTVYTRKIKHASVLLKPLAVFGGAFDKVVPFFWDDIVYEEDSNSFNLKSALETVDAYELEGDNLIFSVNERLNIKGNKEKIIDTHPVKAIKNLAKRLEVGEDNFWYYKE